MDEFVPDNEFVQINYPAIYPQMCEIEGVFGNRDTCFYVFEFKIKKEQNDMNFFDIIKKWQLDVGHELVHEENCLIQVYKSKDVQNNVLLVIKKIQDEKFVCFEFEDRALSNNEKKMLDRYDLLWVLKY